MRIVIISDMEIQGGAAVAASRLANGLLLAGKEVIRIVNQPSSVKGKLKTISVNQNTSKHKLSIAQRIVIRLLPFHYQNKIQTNYYEITVQRDMRDQLEKIRPDIINIHNIHGARPSGWNANIIDIALKYAPVVWTLHDTWSYTGRCAYTYDCSKYMTGCDATCPTASEYPSLSPDLIQKEWHKRQKLFKNNPMLAAVTPSKWLSTEAKTGFWKDHPVEVIPNGLPLNIFKPMDRDLARKALDIKPDKPTLLISAQSLTDRRKGYNYLIEALEQLEYPVCLLSLGHGNLEIKNPNVQILHMGYVDHERTKVLVYNAADMLIHPAPVDNLPNVVLESIACGTPVIGFPIGGMPDMVRPGKTGWLADEVSSTALLATLKIALSELYNGITMRDSCRKIAEDEYSDAIQAERYIKLFQKIIENYK